MKVVAQLNEVIKTPNPDLGLKVGVDYYGDLPSELLEKMRAASIGENMLPLTREAVSSHPLGVVVVDGNEFAGYTAVIGTFHISDTGIKKKALEIGGVIVPPEYRGRALASRMFGLLIYEAGVRADVLKGDLFAAFTNNHSRGYMERAGMVQLGPSQTIDASELTVCSNCPNCPATGTMPWEDPKACCDYENILILPISGN